MLNFICYFISSVSLRSKLFRFQFAILIIFLLPLHMNLLSRISDNTLICTNPSSKPWGTSLQWKSCPCTLTLYILSFNQFLTREDLSSYALTAWFPSVRSVEWKPVVWNVSYQESEYSFRISNLWKGLFDFWRKGKGIVNHLKDVSWHSMSK